MNAKAGKKPYFSDNEELELRNWIFKMQNQGLTVNHDTLLEKANLMMHKKYGGDVKPLTDGWYDGFRDRHHEVVVRVQESLDTNRKKGKDIDRTNVFFDTLDEIIREYNVSPSRIFNCDETGMAKNLTTRTT